MTLPTIKYLTEAYENESLLFGIVPYSPCNLRCGFCCTNNGKKVEGALPTEYYKNLLKDNVNKIGVAYVLSMGEPLLKPDKFFDMVEPVLEADKPVVLFTNGTRIDKKLAKRLVDNKIGVVGKLDKIGIVGMPDDIYGDSSDPFFISNDNAVLDLTDGVGKIYVQVPQYIQNLLDLGIDRDNFALNTVIVKQNSWIVPAKMRALLGKNEINHFAEFPDISGRLEDEETRKKYLLSQEEREKVIGKISRADNYTYKLSKDERHLDIRLLLYRQGNVMFIGPTGNVIVPKKGVVAKGERLGNLQENTLDEILRAA